MGNHAYQAGGKLSQRQESQEFRSCGIEEQSNSREEFKESGIARSPATPLLLQLSPNSLVEKTERAM
jgi:hypothetical protein